MDKATIAERFAEVLAKQRPTQHGVSIGYVDANRESPNWTSVHYFLGTHEECAEMYEKFFAQPTVEAAHGVCMPVSLH